MLSAKKSRPVARRQLATYKLRQNGGKKPRLNARRKCEFLLQLPPFDRVMVRHQMMVRTDWKGSGSVAISRP